MASTTPTKTGGVKRKRNFFNDEELSDVIIRFGDRQVFAHKVILANGSVWFEKALLGNFGEANKKVVELHDDAGHEVIMLMLKHLYGTSYDKQELPSNLDDLPEFHLSVFMLGDKYDVPSLRAEAADRLQDLMSEEFDECVFSDSTIFTIQKTLGPDALQCADTSLELYMVKRVLSSAGDLWCDDTFRSAFVRGEMLKHSIADEFAEEIVNFCH